MKTTAILLASAAMLAGVSAWAQSPNEPNTRSAVGNAAQDATTAASKAGTATGNAIDKAADKATGSPGVDHSKPATKAAKENSPGAPIVGANSFTEGQAKSRIEARGFKTVTALKKDENGIWRGMAQKDGKSTGVALDYQGNVVESSATGATMSGSSTPTPATVKTPPVTNAVPAAPPPASTSMPATTPPAATPAPATNR